MLRSGSSAFTKFYFFFLFADLPVQMMWMASSSLTLRRKERESDVEISHSLQTVLLLLSFSSHFVVHFLFRHVFVYFLFSRFVILETSPSLVILFYLPVCHFFVSVSSFSCFCLVVFHLKQIREPRGALLFVLKEETCGEIHRRRFLSPSGLRD